MTATLSVTVLTSSAETDGARVIERLLRDPDGLRITAIVPRRGQPQQSPRSQVSLLPTTERLVRLGEGCACCTVRGDLMSKIEQIVDEQSADHIVIQAAPSSDLVTIAKTFTVANAAGSMLSEVARIESMVAVVDARRLLATLQTTSARSLIARIELANVIVIVGVGELTPASAERVQAVLEALNPAARIARGDNEHFAISSLRSEHPFDLKTAQRGPAQLERARSTSDLIVPFVYHDRRPFHPTRLHTLLTEPLDGVLRVQGTFWVASRPSHAGILDVAGGSRSTASGGMWWASVPPEQRPSSEAFQDYIDAIWHPAFGDRHQELTIIGLDIDEDDLQSRLDQCLLTDEELAKPEHWPELPHPFSWPKESA